MKRTLLRAGATGAVAAVALGLAVAVSAPANAASIGYAKPNPTTGRVDSLWNVVTQSNCPTGTIAVDALLNGPTGSGWNNDLIVGNTSVGLSTLSTTGVPISADLVSIGTTNTDPTTGLPAPLTVGAGNYTITLECLGGTVTNPVVNATFDGSITVSTGTPNTFAWNAPAAPASTTVVTASPASPQLTGANVTFTATVTSTAAVAGTVQFKDGATNLGTPVTVAAGKATLSTTALAAGAHSITAVFTPTDPTVVAGSTSTAVAYQINAPATTPTLTGSFSPAAPTTADVLVLTATLPTTAVGTVAFTEGTNTVGTASVSGGTASVSLTGVTAGSHSYTATYTPSGASVGVFNSATGAVGPVTVTQFAGVTASETITTTVTAQGTLSITAGSGTVNLGSPVLSTTNNLLVTSPVNINPVTVTDTRTGISGGYTVSGVVADFTDGGSNKINGSNLGWTPAITSGPTGLVAGPAVAPAAGLLATDATVSGLKQSRVLASIPSNSIGTAVLTAALVLQAPTATIPGTYSTTLTLTAI